MCSSGRKIGEFIRDRDVAGIRQAESSPRKHAMEGIKTEEKGKRKNRIW